MKTQVFGRLWPVSSLTLGGGGLGMLWGPTTFAASWGTPDKILRGLEERRRIIGDFELNVAFRFGGTPYEVAERGLKLFAKEVLPVLKSQSAIKIREAAE